MKKANCGIVLLAAGSSLRLGRPKQLLLYKNKTLLQHAIDEATASNTSSIVVVLGANGDDIASQLHPSTAQIVYNENWQEGMASSIRMGLLETLKINPAPDSVIIMLCDQPFVSSQLLNELIEAKETSGKGIIASFYKATAGVPALFSFKYFAQLEQLQGNDGAKKIVMANGDDVATIPFAKGAIDIDTTPDYERLQNESSSPEI